MTQEISRQTLQEWWDGISFNGKELYQLKENGDLVLSFGEGQKERKMVSFSPDNADATFKALADKFGEVEARFKELETEWVSTEDKLKLVGKVERMKEYLLHSNAIGSYDALMKLIADWEKTIAELTEENYQAKLKLVEQAEEVAQQEHFKDASKTFRELTEEWKKIGHVDRHRNDALWNRMEEARTKFFDRKRKNQEDQEKDMLQNLDLKMEIVEKAEAIAATDNWKSGTEAFNTLMDEWKATGRTLPDKNELLWQRFITAKKSFYERKQKHSDEIHKEHEANYILKSAIVEKAEALKDSTEWQTTSQAYADLMEEWKNIGRVNQKKADELWGRFNAAKEVFFQAKRHHFAAYRASMDDNYAQKMALIKRAETLKNSTHWHDATAELNELMDEWKKIGPVARQHSTPMWEQFLAARKEFFERKDASRDRRKVEVKQQFAAREQQSRDQLKQMQHEVKEEEEKLADFRNGLENITPGIKKERELREHLENLIKETEAGIKRLQQKIATMQQQFAQHDAKKAARPTAPKEQSKAKEEQQTSGERASSEEQQHPMPGEQTSAEEIQSPVFEEQTNQEEQQSTSTEENIADDEPSSTREDQTNAGEQAPPDENI